MDYKNSKDVDTVIGTVAPKKAIKRGILLLAKA
jgi:hypothetical protein